MMNMTLEKVIILAVIGVFIVSSVNSLGTLDRPITREEAIEISKNSELVKERLAIVDGIETDYYNSSMVEQLKKGHNGEMYEKVPDGHSAWQVIWWFGYQTQPGWFNVIVIVDAETGAITYETTGITLS